MKYDSSKKYSFYFHYMHYYPMCIVKVQCEGCLLEETLELLNSDPRVIIDNIKEIEE